MVAQYLAEPERLDVSLKGASRDEVVEELKATGVTDAMISMATVCVLPYLPGQDAPGVPPTEGEQRGGTETSLEAESFKKEESASTALDESFVSAVAAFERGSYDPYAELEEKRSSWLAKLEAKLEEVGADLEVEVGNGTVTATTPAPSRTESTVGVVVPAPKPKPKKEPEREAWREGIFAPVVLAAKQVMGEQKLKEVRAAIIAKHSKVIGNFVDTSESEFGQLVLQRMFEYADKDGNGTLDKEEIREALLDLGFDFLDEKQVEKLIKNADADKNDVIDFEEFVAATPKALRINLVKLAKKNGHDLGFLV
jgi:hypothetical protein